MQKEESINKNKNKNIKQILTLILFVIIIIIGIFTNNNYNENNTNNINNTQTITYTLENIPEYSSNPYININNDKPNFNESDFTTESFEIYSDLDDLGRCGVAFANLSKETMPKDDDKRKSLDSIIPSGWQDTEYKEINLNNLYNKCHLIAFSLSAENVNEKNIITGTRYFNTSGMLGLELRVLNYLKENENNHVLYRVTPIYEGDNLVASGVNIEAQSVEDNEISFNVYVYNVQPGIDIDYTTGESKLAE